MTADEVHAYYNNNWSEVCRELKLGKNTSRGWVKKGYISMSMQLRIEAATNGDLVAAVNKPGYNKED